MDKVYVDTNIILDLLLERLPFSEAAKVLFKKAESKEVTILISTMSYISTEYILRKHIGKVKAKQALAKLRTFTSVCKSGETVIDLALASSMKDFEDAFQYYTALQNDASLIITRNPKDFTNALLPIMNANEYLNL